MGRKFLLFYLVFAFCLMGFSCEGQSRRRGGSQLEQETIQSYDTVNRVKVKPVVNVYIENSGSMDGFVNGITEFKGAIGKMLAKLKYYYDEDNVHIFFIRNDKAAKKNGNEKLNVVKACETDISDYANAIDISWKKDMSLRGHNTNLNNIFKEILNRTNDTTISILFSDCIYSIGSGGAADMLNHEKGTTYDAFLTYAKNNRSDLATTIIKMKSKFDGKYYPYTGDRNAFSYKGELPYYICVLANQDILAVFNKNIKLSKGDLEGYDNKYILAHSTSSHPYYSVLMNTENKGRFKQQRKLSSLTYVHGIEDISLKPNKRTGDPFTFAVAIDMSGIDVDDAYILDVNNYVLSEDCFSVVSVIEAKKNSISTSDWQRVKDGNPDYIIILKAENMQWSNIDLGIALKKQVPQWIDESSILDDTRSSNLNGLKSFGLKYWIHGISEAYEELYPEDNNYYEVTVNIKK